MDAARGFGTNVSCSQSKEIQMATQAPKAKKQGQQPLPPPSKNPFALNPEFNRQTRKVLGKHYRTKYGVK